MTDKNIYRILAGVILIQLIIIITLGGQHRFHGDEALYARWAQDMIKSSSIYVESPYLLYKPPVYMLAAALTYVFFPVRELFAVVPNIIATLISTLFIFFCVLKIYADKGKALFAAVLFAMCPLVNLFAPTAFLDPLMICFCLITLYLVLEKKYFSAGMIFGLAMGTKQFALFYLPVYALFILFDEKKYGIKDLLIITGLFIAGFLIIFSLSVVWGILNSLRHGKPFYYALNSWFGVQDRPEAFKFSFDGAAKRAAEWWRYYMLIFSKQWIAILLAGLTVLMLFVKREKGTIVITAGLVLLFLTTVLSGMPIYDRYIITFIPLIVIPAGASLSAVFSFKNNKYMPVFLAAAVILLFAVPVRDMYKYKIRNAQGETFGAQYSANDGFDQIAAKVLKGYDKPVCVNMHRDFSWVTDYYFWGAPEGHCWYHSKDMAAEVKEFNDTYRQRINLVLFYAGNDRISDMMPYLQKYSLSAVPEQTVYNRFNEKSLVMYRIFKTQIK